MTTSTAPATVPRRALAAALPLLALLAAACAPAPIRRDALEASMCSEPGREPRARRVEMDGVTLAVPAGFVLADSAEGYRLYNAGSRWVGLARGQEPHFLVPTPLTAPLEFCEASIAGQPAQVVSMRAQEGIETMTRPSHDAALVEARPATYVAAVRWAGADSARRVTVWVAGGQRTDLIMLRTVFWTVRVAPDSAS